MTKKGRPLGTKNRKWTPEDKERIVLRYYNENISRRQLRKEEGISDGMLHKWIKKYEDGGIEALVSKTGKSGKSGNVFSALHTSKNLPEMKRLQLEVAKLQVEVERLKKGYSAKGVGANKEFVTIKDKSSK